MSHLYAILWGGLIYLGCMLGLSHLNLPEQPFDVVCRLLLLAIFCGGVQVGRLARQNPLASAATFGGLMLLLSLPLYPVCFAQPPEYSLASAGMASVVRLLGALVLTCLSAILGASIGQCFNPFTPDNPPHH